MKNKFNYFLAFSFMYLAVIQTTLGQNLLDCTPMGTWTEVNFIGHWDNKTYYEFCDVNTCIFKYYNEVSDIWVDFPVASPGSFNEHIGTINGKEYFTLSIGNLSKFYEWDGTAWTDVPFPVAAIFISQTLVGNAGIYINFYSFDNFFFDGTTWTNMNDNTAYFMYESNGLLYAKVSGIAGVLSTYDGMSWTTLPMPALTYTGLDYLGEGEGLRYFAFYVNGFVRLYTYDGSNWASISEPYDSEYITFSTTAHGKALFNVFDSNFNLEPYSYDGTNWLALSLPGIIVEFHFINKFNSRYYFSAYDNVDQSYHVFHTDNALNWQEVGIYVPDNGSFDHFFNYAFDNLMTKHSANLVYKIDDACTNPNLVLDYQTVQSGTYHADLINSGGGVASESSVTYKAEQSIQLNSNFEVALGAVFSAFIEVCN